MSNRAVYKRFRPQLVIEYVSGASMGNCYSSVAYKVTSWHKLSKDTLMNMNKAGILGIGQEFFIRSQCDGKEEPAGYDESPCVEVDRQGNVVNTTPINKYSGMPYGNIKEAYYEYICEARCDSSD
jgi:hypothetical protein